MEDTEINTLDNDNLIKNWLAKINIKPISSEVVLSMNEFALYNLIEFFYLFKNEKCKKYKVIKKNEKQFLEVYDNDLLQLFYKKKINSDWTYIRNSYYEIRFNITIYLFQEKSYKTKRKSKSKSKSNNSDDNNKSKNIKTKKTNLSDFFDHNSDSD